MQKLLAAVTLVALSGFGQGAFADSEKVTICHKGVQTAAVPTSAVQGHLQHGDSRGECDHSPPGMAAVVMMRCEPQVDGATSGVFVVAVSSSPSPAIPGSEPIAPGDDCAAVVGDLLDAGFDVRSVTTGTAEDDGALHLYTDYLLIGKAPATP